MKKTFAILFALALALTCLWAFSVETNAATDDYYVYGVSGGKATITDCSTSISGNIVIPDSLGGYPVIAIDSLAFQGCTGLISVTIPDGVTTIGSSVFKNCTELTTVIIPDSVTTIGSSAFYNCDSLTTVTIPNNITSISSSTFYSCDNLTTVTIPGGLTFIGSESFYGCTKLQTVYYGSDSIKWNQILIGSSNSPLTGATIHYNHVHDYELLPPVIEPATCQNAGYIEYTCALGETYREILPQLAHTPAETGTVVPPTCTEDGYTGIFCTTCNTLLSTYDIVPSPGHNMVLAPASPATCTQPGLTAGTICNNCQLVGVPQTEIPATNHNFENNVCTECGEPEFKPGDVTGNGEIDSADGLLLMQYLNGWELTDVEESALDVSGDGKVDSLDGLLLMRFLNGWFI